MCGGGGGLRALPPQAVDLKYGSIHGPGTGDPPGPRLLLGSGLVQIVGGQGRAGDP